jgi:hypothetical protein
MKLTTRIPGAAIILSGSAETRPRSFISLSDIVRKELDHKKRARKGSKSRIISITSISLKPREALTAFDLAISISALPALMSNLSGIFGCCILGNFCIN